MRRPKYDIFISYRRDDGRQYARLIERELKYRGFTVFLDYEELKDGIFETTIRDAISSAKVFIMILTPQYLSRCKNENDWVRKEIDFANQRGLHFVPIVPDGAITSYPEKITSKLPDFINKVVLQEQWSDVNFGQTMTSTFDQMVSDRLIKHVKPRPIKVRKIIARIIAIALILYFGIGLYNYLHQQSLRRMLFVDETNGFVMNWYKNISLNQLQAATSILDNMVFVEGGSFMMGGDNYSTAEPDLESPSVRCDVPSFYMSKYELSVEQWCKVMGQSYDKKNANLPMVGISYNDCLDFTIKLSNLTGLNVSIPTEAEWEYAARGGKKPTGTLYPGSDEVTDVAWYVKNSNGVRHECDATNSPLTCNSLDIFDMGGNVCEWCEWTDPEYRLNSDMISKKRSNDIIYNANLKPHRGGAFDCEAYQTTVFHRETANQDSGCDNIGLRLVIH